VGVAADAAADVDVGVAVCGILEQADRALAHDGDDRIRDAVARAQRERASAELKNVR
jgi:1,4-dihydroxy-2-naphthoyl-CoA synthase